MMEVVDLRDGGRFEMETDEDTRGKETKKRKVNEESEEEEKYVIGIVSEEPRDGIFSDPHAVAKFVVRKLGKVNSVRVTRRGMVIVECKSSEQARKAIVSIDRMGEYPLETFELGARKWRKGVISGVPMSVKIS